MSGSPRGAGPLVPLDTIARDRLLTAWNAAAAFDQLTPTTLAEKLDVEPPEAAACGFAAVCDEVVAGWAFGVLRPSPGGPRGVVKLLAVAPRFRRRGIGSALLAAVEARLVQAGATKIRFGESAPNYLVPGVDQRCEPLLCLLEGRGYARIGTTVNMAVDLEADGFLTAAEETRLAAAGITIRRPGPADVASLGSLVHARWPGWAGEVAAAVSRRPAAVHVACRPDGAVVGFAAYDGNNVGTGWFGPMGTASEWEGRGIGRVLLRRCLQDLCGQGLKEAVIPWVGPVSFYERHAAAKVSRTFIRFEKPVPPAGDRPA